MKLNASVWKAMLYLHTVRFLDKCHAVEQRVSFLYRTRMRGALATQLVFHSQKKLKKVHRALWRPLPICIYSVTNVVVS